MLKVILNTLLGLYGKEIRSVSAPLHTFEQSLAEIARRFEIGAVIDIGVAEGTPELHRAFPKTPFLLVEANPQYTEELQKKAQAHGWMFAPVFCGESETTVPFRLYASGRKASAHMSENQDNEKNFVETISIPCKPLDTLLSQNLLPSPYLIKIDTEGAEMSVLRGATAALAQAAAVIVETSIVKRYVGGSEFADVVAYMHTQGFSVFDMCEGTIEDGRLLMVDVVFIRTDSPVRLL